MRAILLRGTEGVAVLGQRAGGEHAGVEVVGIEHAQADDHLVGPGAVAARPAAVGDAEEVGLGVGEESLPRRDLAKVQMNHFLVRLDLEDLFVDRRGLGVEPLVHQVIGDLHVLRSRLTGLRGADVEVAERIPGVPVARVILDHAARTRQWRDRASPAGAAFPLS